MYHSHELSMGAIMLDSPSSFRIPLLLYGELDAQGRRGNKRIVLAAPGPRPCGPGKNKTGSHEKSRRLRRVSSPATCVYTGYSTDHREDEPETHRQASQKRVGCPNSRHRLLLRHRKFLRQKVIASRSSLVLVPAPVRPLRKRCRGCSSHMYGSPIHPKDHSHRN